MFVIHVHSLHLKKTNYYVNVCNSNDHVEFWTHCTVLHILNVTKVCLVYPLRLVFIHRLSRLVLGDPSRLVGGIPRFLMTSYQDIPHLNVLSPPGADLCNEWSMNTMKLVIPLHWLYWSIHTKDESKRGTAFAFIFGVNWLWRWGVTASFGVFF